MLNTPELHQRQQQDNQGDSDSVCNEAERECDARKNLKETQPELRNKVLLAMCMGLKAHELFCQFSLLIMILGKDKMIVGTEVNGIHNGPDTDKNLDMADAVN